MEIGTEISRKIRVRPASGGGGKPGLSGRAGARLSGVTGTVGPAWTPRPSRRRGLYCEPRGRRTAPPRPGAPRADGPPRARRASGAAAGVSRRQRKEAWSAGREACSAAARGAPRGRGTGEGTRAPPRPHLGDEGAGGARSCQVPSALGIRVVFRLPHNARFFLFPQSAIKGKLQELGAYVGKFCCFVSVIEFRLCC